MEATVSVQRDGGPAFPVVWQDIPHGGMTPRDWFAGQALPVYLNRHPADRMTPERVAAATYAMADAMLAERNKEIKT